MYELDVSEIEYALDTDSSYDTDDLNGNDFAYGMLWAVGCVAAAGALSIYFTRQAELEAERENYVQQYMKTKKLKTTQPPGWLPRFSIFGGKSELDIRVNPTAEAQEWADRLMETKGFFDSMNIDTLPEYLDNYWLGVGAVVGILPVGAAIAKSGKK